MEILNPWLILAEPWPNRSTEEAAPTKGTIIKALVLAGADPGRVFLKTGTRLFQADLSQPLTPGREVTLHVAETTPRLILHLLPEPPETAPISESPYVRPALARQIQAEIKAPVLTAQVLSQTAPDRIRIRILVPPMSEFEPAGGSLIHKTGLTAGREITARLIQIATPLEFKPSQEVRFIINAIRPRLVLQVDQREIQPQSSSPLRGPLGQALTGFLRAPGLLAESAARLLAGLPREADLPEPVQTKIHALKRLLLDLSPRNEEKDHLFPTRLLGNLGLKGERSPIQEAAARLMAELIRLADREAVPEKVVCSLFEAAAKVHQAVDLAQNLNQAAYSQDQTLHLPFPLFWPGFEGRGELTLQKSDEEGKKSAKDAPFKISFLLELTRLGRIKVDLELKQRSLTGVIWTERGPVLTAMDQALGRLLNSLSARGFKIAELSVRPFPAHQNPPESLAEQLWPRDQSLVDLKV
ncbi:MAG: flagellar hook-length control protein FliK [Thermodesulfobacteriota bacterium]